jgi:hypothetical protein
MAAFAVVASAPVFQNCTAATVVEEFAFRKLFLHPTVKDNTTIKLSPTAFFK